MSEVYMVRGNKSEHVHMLARRLLPVALAALLVPALLAGCIERAPGHELPRHIWGAPAGCTDPPPAAEHEISECIEKAGLAFYERLLGPAFFAAWRPTLNATHSRYCDADPHPCPKWAEGPVYHLVFDLHVPEAAPDTLAGVAYLSKEGAVLAKGGHGHIPACSVRPEECRFISRAEAVGIAERVGMGPGVRPWDIHLGWNGRYDAWTWDLRNTTHETPAPGHGASGTYAHLDARTGEVLKLSGWGAW